MDQETPNPIAPPEDTIKEIDILVERQEAKSIIESLLFASDKPLSLNKICDLLGKGIDKNKVLEVIAELQKDYDMQGRSFTVAEIAEGFQLVTRPRFAPWLKKLFKTRIMTRISRGALETLAIIAYKQPVTRADIESIRGVSVEGVLHTLLERKLVKIIGRKEVAGRPLVYGTDQEFLRYFGLKNLSDLPQIKELKEVLGEEQTYQELLPLDFLEERLPSRRLLEEMEKIRALESSNDPTNPNPNESEKKDASTNFDELHE